MTCRRHPRRPWALFGAIAALAHAPWTLAAGPGSEARLSYQLHWVRDPGAEGCASSTELSKSLDTLLGGGRLGVTGNALRLEGRASAAATGPGYRIQVRVLDDEGNPLGERELATQSESCSALTSRVLLVLAMILNPESNPDSLSSAIDTTSRTHLADDPDQAPHTADDAAWMPSQDGSKKGQVSTTGPEGTAPDVRPVDSPSRTVANAAKPVDTREPTRYRASVGMALTPGLVPRGSVGMGLMMRALREQTWSFALGGFAFWPGTVATPRAEVNIGAAHGAIDVCGKVLGRGSLGLAACAGGLVGVRWLNSDTLTRTSANPSLRRYFGPQVGLDLSVGFRQVYSLELGIRLTVEALRERFVYQDTAGETFELFKPALVFAYGFAGLGARL